MIGKAEAADDKGGKVEVKRSGLHALLGGLRDRRGRPERRVGAPGTGIPIRRSTSARTAPRAPPCASTA